MSKSPITSHVLDTHRGGAATGVPVQLEKQISKTEWKTLGHGATNADGRVETLLPAGAKTEPGVYRLTFDTAAYFQKSGSTSFYPCVVVIFEVREDRAHYHVPLLLSPFGYTTYRGT